MHFGRIVIMSSKSEFHIAGPTFGKSHRADSGGWSVSDHSSFILQAGSESSVGLSFASGSRMIKWTSGGTSVSDGSRRASAVRGRSTTKSSSFPFSVVVALTCQAVPIITMPSPWRNSWFDV
jgi:hypothetical protein